MNSDSIPTAVIVSIFAIIAIAFTGICCALFAWFRISKERKKINNAGTILLPDDAWDGAYSHDKLGLAKWLRRVGVESDSHLGDLIRTCWSAWLGGRPASLTELHALAIRRERSKLSARLSSGIAALLLVCGIVGTLLAIKPVLQNFKFELAVQESSSSQGVDYTEDDERAKDTETVAANTELVNNLIYSLGNAFHPSLAALFLTILVASVRGGYSLSLHGLTMEMDRFAVDTLIPRYRVPSLSEQYQDVKATLKDVTVSIMERENNFHQVVERMDSIVRGVGPAMKELNQAAESGKAAADSLTAKSKSISEGLIKHLGAKSVMYKAVTSLEKTYDKTEQAILNIEGAVDKLDQTNDAAQKGLEESLESLSRAIEGIAGDHENHQVQVDAAYKDFSEKLKKVPRDVEAESKRAASVVEATVTSTMNDIRGSQQKAHVESTKYLKDSTDVAVKSLKDAADAYTKGMDTYSSSEVGKIAVKAKTEISSISTAGSENIKATGEDAATKIKIASEQIGAVIKDLEVQPPAPPTIHSTPGYGTPPSQESPPKQVAAPVDYGHSGHHPQTPTEHSPARSGVQSDETGSEEVSGADPMKQALDPNAETFDEVPAQQRPENKQPSYSTLGRDHRGSGQLPSMQNTQSPSRGGGGASESSKTEEGFF
ncbi:hypothetical protein N9881_00615 [bacterium]|nr:hypothetical protein [bacterium]